MDAAVREVGGGPTRPPRAAIAAAAPRERWLRALLEASPAAMVVADAAGRILVVNRRAERLFGHSPEGFAGLSFDDLLPPRRRASFASDRRRCLAILARRSSVRPREFTALHRDGREMPVEVTLTPLQGDEELLYVAAIVDVSRRHALEAERETLLQLLEQSPDFVGLADLDGRLRYLNSTARAMVGHDAADYVGRPAAEYVAPRSKSYFDEVLMPKVHARGAAAGEMALRNLRTGEEIDVHRSIFLVRDPETARPVGYGSVTRDVRDQHAAHRALDAERRRLHLALDAGGMGMWEWDFVRNRSLWNAREYELLGLAPDPVGIVDTNAFLERIVPEDRPAVEAAIARTIAAGEDFVQEFRIEVPDRGTRWLAAHGRLVPDGEGGVRMLGLNWDVTERREREEALRIANERAHTTLELLTRAEAAARVGAFVDRVDREDGLVWSDTLRAILGMPKDEQPLRARAFDVYPPAFAAVLRAAIAKSKQDGASIEIELPLLPAPGRAEWVRVYMVPHFENGTCVQFGGAMQDITDRKRLELEVVAAANAERERIGADLHDDLGQVLTGLSLQLHAHARRASARPEFAESVTLLETTLQRARETCRRLSRAYVAPVSVEGFEAMLLQLAADVPDEIRCFVHASHPLPPKTPMNVAQELFRIAQEAVSNAIRHSGCETVRVDLGVHRDRLELSIEDDGVGPPANVPAGGVGLTSMRSRAAKIGGLLGIASNPAGGTTVRVTVARHD